MRFLSALLSVWCNGFVRDQCAFVLTVFAVAKNRSVAAAAYLFVAVYVRLPAFVTKPSGDACIQSIGTFGEITAINLIH